MFRTVKSLIAYKKSDCKKISYRRFSEQIWKNIKNDIIVKPHYTYPALYGRHVLRNEIQYG